jgi:hypothetical protein
MSNDEHDTMQTPRDTRSSTRPEPDRPPSRRDVAAAPPPPDDALDADEAGAEDLYAGLFGTPALDPPPSAHDVFYRALTTLIRWPWLIGTLKAAVQAAENMRVERARPFDYEITRTRGGQSA